jgi:glutamyl-tRNA reductase
MVNSLNLWNFPAGQNLDISPAADSFVLQTCQRTIVLSYKQRPFDHQPLPLHEKAEGPQAYLYLLETICGLKSKLLGENEIVGQFKDAYKNFTSANERDSRLLIVLEKLFKDAKEIRTQHLIGIGQKTYAHLTRRHFSGKIKQEPILILGSGQLAEDLINQFKKRQPILLSARNSTRAEELAEIHDCKVLPFDPDQWIKRAYIANTIGFDGTLIDDTFFKPWAQQNGQRLLVDLGSPSCLKTDLTRDDGILRLEDIFAEGALMEDQKRARINLARQALHDIVEHRVRWLEEKQLKWQTASVAEVSAPEIHA